MKYLLLFLFPLNALSQGVNNLWLMGGSSWAGPPYGITNMDFTGGSLIINYENLKMTFATTNGIICDKAGNRLFYSNGVWVANSDNDTMSNGSGLNPSSYTTTNLDNGLYLPQGNLIIPFPDDSTKYYLFHETVDDDVATFVTKYLYYSVIDMKQDGGKGDVVQKNIVLLTDSLVPGRLTACKHGNGRDWWIIAHRWLTNRYYKYLITPSGIQGPYIQDIGAVRNITAGQCAFSPDGKYFAYYDYLDDLDIFDFDRCSGNLSLKTHMNINDNANLGGIAFSSSSQVLYVSSEQYVYQFDMNSGNIPASKDTIAVWDGYYSPAPPLGTLFYLAQLAPDGKIYINCGNSTVDIHVINKPDSLGLACDLQQHSIHLPAYNAFTIANHPNYFLGALTGSVCDSLTGIIDNGQLTINNEIQIYPNPVNGGAEVTFTYSSTGEQKEIVIYDINGREVMRYSVPQWSGVKRVKLPALTKGIYLARLLKQNIEYSTTNVKFIIQ